MSIIVTRMAIVQNLKVIHTVSEGVRGVVVIANRVAGVTTRYEPV